VGLCLGFDVYDVINAIWYGLYYIVQRKKDLC